MLMLDPELLEGDLLGFLGGSLAGLFSGLLVLNVMTLPLLSALLTVTGDLFTHTFYDNMSIVGKFDAKLSPVRRGWVHVLANSPDIRSVPLEVDDGLCIRGRGLRR